MRSLFDFLSPLHRRAIFLALLALTLGLLILFQPLNAPLQTPAAPAGIVSLQLAWTPEKAQAMLDSWGTRASLFAAFGLGFDYLFMASYALTLALAARLAAGRHTPAEGPAGWFPRLGLWVATGAFLAAAFDAAENIGQALQLFNRQVGLAPFVGVCATVKFTLIFLGIAYGLIGWLWPKRK
jgi:hypothetical protein